MIEQVRTAYRYFLIMGIGAVLFLFSVMVPVLSSSADFSIYNTGWNGCSNLGKDVYSTGSFLPTVDISSSSEEMVVHNSFNELEDQLDPGDSAIMIIGPDIDFDGSEGRFMDDFLRKGGILLLADDIGTGNDLLGYLNTSTRISGDIMIDLSYMKKGEFAVTSNFSNHPITQDLTSILLNYPSIITPSEKASALVNSSQTSWLDVERNERLDMNEPEGPFPILTMERYGKGELIVLSEPSLLINQMQDQLDNNRFARNLIDHISENRSTVVIDESHRDLTNPVQVANIFITDTSPGQKIGIMVFVTLIFLLWSSPLPRLILSTSSRWIQRMLTEKQPEKEAKDPVDVVMERHPDWDRSALERIIAGTGEIA